MDLTTIILAAGKGTRMNSDSPKVLLEVGGQPMIVNSTRQAEQMGSEDIRVVVGYKSGMVENALSQAGSKAKTFLQEQQLGTGDAVRCALDDEMREWTLIVNGDHPLVDAAGFRSAYDSCMQSSFDLLVSSIEADEESRFGRIIRGPEGEFEEIIEYVDATDEQRKITEVNINMYIARSSLLRDLIGKITNDNNQGELYITDIAAMARRAGYKVGAIPVSTYMGIGVNTPEDLAYAEKMAAKR